MADVAEKKEPLTQDLREHYREMLVTLYEVDEKEVAQLGDEALVAMLRQKEKDGLAKARNPNAFWVLKSLPPPKEVKPTTRSRVGLWVVLSLVFVLLGFLAMALLLAFLK